MLRIAICDADARARAETRVLLDAFFASRGRLAEVWEYAAASGLLFAMEEQVFDLYFLEAMMLEMSGIELGHRLRELDGTGLIVYLTKSPEFAVDSYAVSAFFYLLKPLREAELFSVLDRALERIAASPSDVLTLKLREGVIRMHCDDVYYAKSEGRAIRYVCRTGIREGPTGAAPFREKAAVLLAHPNFWLCGASLVLNLRHVRMVGRTEVELATGERIAIPRRHSGALLQAWNSIFDN